MFRGEEGKSFYINKYYEILDIVLGRGNFSTVYLARHLTFGNQVAFKVIDRNDIKEEYVRKNLHREAKILMKLNHPNIVHFYEEVSEKDLYCLSLEYIKGTDLSQHLKKQPYLRLSEKVAKTLFFQMVSAVDHMHYNNILHRDLKQENILLEHGKVIKIVDFGLSNIYQPRVRLRTHCGSMVYAAPELFQNRSVYGAGVDLWSLGVILYSMVTGFMPFELDRRLEGNASSPHKKDLFFRRISQGLTQENYLAMQELSLDCCNLLKNLLQPDQFKRMQIQAVILHPWFHKDTDLKRRLPIHRIDLRERFSPEIIDFMADKMHVSRERVQNHVRNFKFDKICAIFNILRDTLMKEILYPTKVLESSFLLRFEKWRKGLDTDESITDDSTVEKNLTVSTVHITRHPPRIGMVKNYSKPDFKDKNVYRNATNFARQSHQKDDHKDILIAKRQTHDNFVPKHSNYLKGNSIEFNTDNIARASAANQANYSINSVYNSNRYKNIYPTYNTATRTGVNQSYAEDSRLKPNNILAPSRLNSYQNKYITGEKPSTVCNRGEFLGYSGIPKMRTRVGDGMGNHTSNSDKSSTKQTSPEKVIQTEILQRKNFPVKSYKNSRPVALRQNLAKNQSEANADTRETNKYVSKMNEKRDTGMCDKIIVLSKHLNQGDINNSKARNKPETEYISNIRRNLKSHYLSSQRKVSENSPTLSHQSNNPSTRQFKPAFGGPRNSDVVNEIPKQCESFIQRNILISRADRGHGRTFFNNSNILPRSFRKHISSTSGQKSPLEDEDELDE